MDLESLERRCAAIDENDHLFAIPIVDVRDLVALLRAEQWQPVETIPMDRPVWLLLLPEIPERPSHPLAGRQLPARHQGFTTDGYDMGWNIYLPVGYGGIPTEWIARWRPLMAEPV